MSLTWNADTQFPTGCRDDWVEDSEEPESVERKRTLQLPDALTLPELLTGRVLRQWEWEEVMAGLPLLILKIEVDMAEVEADSEAVTIADLGVIVDQGVVVDLAVTTVDPAVTTVDPVVTTVDRLLPMVAGEVAAIDMDLLAIDLLTVIVTGTDEALLHLETAGVIASATDRGAQITVDSRVEEDTK